MDKKEIIETAHEYSSSNLAREYFKQGGLSFSDINIEVCKKLKDFINAEILPLLLDESYSMVRDYSVSPNIKHDEWGFYLTCNANYFKGREAITFWDPNHRENDSELVVGFCGWADGCNRIPIIKGFIKWCDWMKKEAKK